MSAITSLIASNEKGILPPRIDLEENEIEITLVDGQAVPFQSSHVDQSTIADANYYLPILWLSVFSPKDLFKVTLDGNTYACPSVEVAIAKQRFALRRSLIQATFPHFLEQIALWEQALNEIEHDYLTIDGSQVFFMEEGNVFATAFEQALRWFENGSREDFQGIITLASLSYDPENKRYSVWKQPKLHFTGFLYDHVETGDEPEERDIDMPVSESMGGVVRFAEVTKLLKKGRPATKKKVNAQQKAEEHKKRMAVLYQDAIERILKVSTKINDPIQDQDGGITEDVRFDYRRKAIRGYQINKNPAEFRQSMLESVKLMIALYERFDQGEPIYKSYIATSSTTKLALCDALSTGNTSLIKQLASMVFQRQDLEQASENWHALSIDVLAAFILETPDRSDYLDRFIQDYAGRGSCDSLIRIYQAILHNDHAGLADTQQLLLKTHKACCRPDGIYYMTLDEDICMTALGIYNLAAMYGISVDVDDPLIPKALILKTDDFY